VRDEYLATGARRRGGDASDRLWIDVTGFDDVVAQREWTRSNGHRSCSDTEQRSREEGARSQPSRKWEHRLDQEKFTGMDATANADDFIVAYPQGLIPDGSGFDWNVPGVALFGGSAVPSNAANDIKFLTTLVGISSTSTASTRVRSTRRIFRRRARSKSAGVRRVIALRAVAPVSGLRRPAPCPTTRAVPIISFHGSADEVDPFAGHGQKYWTYSVATAAKDWAKQITARRRL